MTRILTLCGVKQARVGFTFLAGETAEVCVKCRLYRVCTGKLEPFRPYRVVEVKSRVFPCPLHEGGVRLVVVEESSVEAALDERLTVEGAAVSFKPINCMISCPHRNLCNPEGLMEGDMCRIVKVGDRVDCLGGLRLRRVTLKRIQPRLV